jgi:hypothetical protein
LSYILGHVTVFYPSEESQKAMHLYRLLTGPDDASFCKRVTKALNEGWSLYGSPSYSYNKNTKAMQCAQAVIKEQDGIYDPDKPLTQQGHQHGE